jgi:hypothetical protein
MTVNSLSVSLSGLLRISVGVRTLPMSHQSEADLAKRRAPIPSVRACDIVRIETFTIA